jgi:hypothetical protein
MHDLFGQYYDDDLLKPKLLPRSILWVPITKTRISTTTTTTSLLFVLQKTLMMIIE